ncbi:uncharacterized protein LOC110979113 [Acanthaster planci]|uniref:Uncharacterized protein LOC110979113 n=1 Tax=Acanthaster planci TaxID=133434 RepID=A0A8B7YCR2_ACAPL|nr:uncharacterized protein LOC110979113 [Acanthaster planci]
MPFMQRCCCCDVRTGSIVVAIWTMISAAASIDQSVRMWVQLPHDAQIDDSNFVAYYAAMTIVNSLLGLSALALLFGVIKYKKEWMIPYMILQGLLIFLELILMVIVIVLLANGNILVFNFLGISLEGQTLEEQMEIVRIVYGILAASLLLGILLELLFFFCVVSHFQQLRDGTYPGPGHVLIVNQECTPIVDTCPPPKQGYYTSC